MADNIFELSPTETVTRFRDAAELLLGLHGELNESVRSTLQAKSEEMHLLPADFGRILDEVKTLPSVVAKFEECRKKPLEYRLEHAEPEATIKLEPGEYVITTPLLIRKSVTIVGSGQDRTRIVSDAPYFVMGFEGDGSFGLHGLTVEHRGKNPATVIYVTRGDVKIIDCQITGGIKRENQNSEKSDKKKVGDAGLHENDSTNSDIPIEEKKELAEGVTTIIKDNDPLGDGITLIGLTRGEIKKCIITGNAGNGVCIIDTPQSRVENNTCHGNKQAGIAYYGCSAGIAQGNSCLRNEIYGIYLGEQAHPTLENNTCQENKYSGIGYLGNSAGTARGSTCLRNQMHGICLTEQAHPRLENNTCQENNCEGIFYSGSSVGIALGNACLRNEHHGIYLSEQAQPTLENNTCIANKYSGIAYFGSSTGTAWGNACLRNEMHGIYLTEQARPTLVNNTCTGNMQEVNHFVENPPIQFAQNEIAPYPNAHIRSASAGDFIFVKGGTFKMGTNREENEEPIHSVTLSDFYIGKYEITQKQWRDVMGTNPSHFEGDELPVEQVSYSDVKEFMRKLNEKEGGLVYRLPTEAEWEYAARGGANSRGYPYSGGNIIGDVAWFGGNSEGITHAVGTKYSNELGLYDMSGNVVEWCSDWYDGNYYKISADKDPQGPETGVSRVLRGGSWVNANDNARSTNRGWNLPDGRYYNVGFRCAMNVR